MGGREVSDYGGCPIASLIGLLNARATSFLDIDHPAILELHGEALAVKSSQAACHMYPHPQLTSAFDVLVSWLPHDLSDLGLGHSNLDAIGILETKVPSGRGAAGGQQQD